MTRPCTCVVLGPVLAAGWAVASPAAAPANTVERTAATSAPASVFDLAKLLADPPELGIAHERELAALEAAITQSDTAADQAAGQLALANWHLAVPAARPATRWLLNLDQEADRRSIAQAAESARKHLDRARELLKAIRDDDAKKSRRRELESAAETLASFADLFAAAPLKDRQEQYQSACKEAALGLAVARESEDAAVGAAALLWQSFGYGAAGQRERALAALPEGLSKPRQMPYDLVSRFLRCRVLADEGRFAAASALTIKIEASLEAWLTGQSDEVIAAHRRLAALMRLEIGQAWLARLQESRSAAAAPLDAWLNRVQQAELPDSAEAVYHLSRAVPIIVEPPATAPSQASSSPATSTAPADSPDSEAGEPDAEE